MHCPPALVDLPLEVDCHDGQEENYGDSGADHGRHIHGGCDWAEKEVGAEKLIAGVVFLLFFLFHIRRSVGLHLIPLLSKKGWAEDADFEM